LIRVLLVDEDVSSNMIQISFDLLGELVKSNIITISLLEKILEQEGLVDVFIHKVMSNLEDSNVFLRHLILSKERFQVSAEYVRIFSR
jgi:hypothetical protein